MPSVAYGATFRLFGPKGERMVPAADYFTMPTLQNVQRENVLAPDELLTHVILPAPGSVKSGHYEVRYKESHDWPIAFATVLLTMAGDTVSPRGSSWARLRRSPGDRRRRRRHWPGRPSTSRPRRPRQMPRSATRRPMSQNGYKIQVAKTAVKRAILNAAGLNVPGTKDPLSAEQPWNH